mmetsp:Transcript_70614/g.111713  ORF Transcript_70614/g.111713 Transcript_70614/m.111713 type:complete len:552 (+) Transcript_70614:79-1734(+)
MQAALFMCLALPLIEASSESFHRGGALRATVESATFHAELQEAMGEALGCGGEVSEEHLKTLEDEMSSVYATLPKNSLGRIDRRSLRFLAYRYFNEKHSLAIRGFEPSRVSNDSSWAAAEILSQRVPSYVESVLMSRHADTRGFDLRDTALVITTIEQLLFDTESNLLEKVYKEKRKSHESLRREDLQDLLEAYLVHWLMGNDEEGIRLLLGNARLRQRTFPHWDQLVHFAHGEVQALDFKRQHGGTGTLQTEYSFDDAHEVIGGITRNFASFWESECTEMKEQLIAMDPSRTGRVPLSRFYGTGLEADWRFAESEAYLRELGALDESSRTKQVIIPNYIQAASNCIVATNHYMVCCHNDCNPLLAEIEQAIHAPFAAPERLLEVVKNMTTMTSLEVEHPARLDSTLLAQLRQIAASHNGEVPLHGRLFLQWLHYVFPQQCAFPHKSGTTNALSPLEFQGGEYVASQSTMMEHSKGANESEEEDEEWMALWSEEEELIAGYEELHWTARVSQKCGFICFGLAALLGAIRLNWKPKAEIELLPSYRGKAHFV